MADNAKPTKPVRLKKRQERRMIAVERTAKVLAGSTLVSKGPIPEASDLLDVADYVITGEC